MKAVDFDPFEARSDLYFTIEKYVFYTPLERFAYFWGGVEKASDFEGQLGVKCIFLISFDAVLPFSTVSSRSGDSKREVLRSVCVSFVKYRLLVTLASKIGHSVREGSCKMPPRLDETAYVVGI